MNVDKPTMIIIGALLIPMTAFVIINNAALTYAINTISPHIGSDLIFLCIMGMLMVILSFRRDRRSTVIGTFLPVILLLFVLLYNSLLTHGISNINLQAPIERIPVDFGLMGFVFILINGFLISHILIVKNVDKTERLLLTIGLGFGTTSFIMILLGILWELSILNVILAQVTILIIALIVALHKGFTLDLKIQNPLKEKRGHITKVNLLKMIMLAIICIHTIIATYQTIAYPAIEWDSLAYGLNYAKIIYENRRVPMIAGPSIGLQMSASYPPGVQLLAVYLYLFAGAPNDFYYRILQPIFGLAVMLITYKLAICATKNRTFSLFAVLILVIIPVFWDNFVLETYLMNLTLMLMLCAYFFFKAYDLSDSSKEKYEVVGALFCAFSALASYIGLCSLGILLLYAINKKIRPKRLIWLVTLVSLVTLPWYTRNFLLLGNPIYPFLGFGKYLDPLLKNSTAQHFQNWLKGALFGLVSIIAKLGVCILSLTIAYRTFVKHNSLIMTFTLYVLFVSSLIMAFYIPFTRYLIVSIPLLSVVFSAAVKASLAKQDTVEKSIGGVLILLILISNTDVIFYLNNTKPMYSANNKWDYLTQLYEDADAWKWINENTPQSVGIATYDIREYYIGRKVMALDGYSAAPLYKMDTIEEAIKYLTEQNIAYILSVTWASPMDARMPPAYKWCILTRYLGDPRYLPPVYVGSKGAAVYHVGPTEEKTVYASFSQEDFAPPIRHLEINLTITNETHPSSGKFYIPIPVDYREGLMMASVNSSKHMVNVGLWTGIIPENTSTNQLEEPELVKEWPVQSANNSGVENPSFVWQVDRAGYFTFLITDQEETFRGSFNVTVDIRFYDYWDINSLFIPQGVNTYNITTSNATFPLMKTLYIQANEPSILSINTTTFNKKICLEIFNDLVPNDTVINWDEQYQLTRWQPSFNNSGEVDPSIQNMFLPNGKYSILVIYGDNYTEQANALLKVEFTSLG